MCLILIYLEPFLILPSLNFFTGFYSDLGPNSPFTQDTKNAYQAKAKAKEQQRPASRKTCINPNGVPQFIQPKSLYPKRG